MIFQCVVNPHRNLHIYTNANIDWVALANEWQQNSDFMVSEDPAVNQPAPGFWVEAELAANPGQTVIGGDTSEWPSYHELDDWNQNMVEAISRHTL